MRSHSKESETTSRSEAERNSLIFIQLFKMRRIKISYSTVGLELPVLCTIHFSTRDVQSSRMHKMRGYLTKVSLLPVDNSRKVQNRRMHKMRGYLTKVSVLPVDNSRKVRNRRMHKMRGYLTKVSRTVSRQQ